MAIADYLPNVFGGINPQIAGLLGEEQAGVLQKQSNMAGLLGAAAALAQGMSPQGYRRSAAQNILSALGAGFQTAAQTNQQGLQSYVQQQQIQEQFNKQNAYKAAAEKYPDLAPLARLAPEKFVEMVALRERQKPIDEAYKDDLPMAPAAVPSPAVPSPAAPMAAGITGQTTDGMLPGVEVTAAKPPVDPMLAGLVAQKERLIRANSRLARLPYKEANDEVRNNLEIIKNLDEQIGRYGVRGIDLGAVVSALPAELKPRGEMLLQVQEYLTPDQLTQRMEALMKDAQLKTSDIQEYQYAQSRGYKGSFEDWVKFTGNSRAPKTSIDLSNRKFGEAVAGKTADITERSYNNALGAKGTLDTISVIRPMVQQGVYAGPLSGSMQTVDRLASVFDIASRDTQEKLTRTAEAMQGLAKLELSSAEAMRGQGQITEAERSIIRRAAAGDFATFTQPEVLSLLNALEKTSNAKIAAHQKTVKFLRNKPETRDLADMFDIEPPSQQPVNIQDAARQELQRRKGK